MLRFDVMLSGFNKDILCNLIVTDIVLNQFSKKSNIFFFAEKQKNKQMVFSNSGFN